MKKLLILQIIFSFGIISAQSVNAFTKDEQRTISSFGGGCLHSTFADGKEIDENRIFLINVEDVYFLKVDGRTFLLTSKTHSYDNSRIIADNHMYKIELALPDENNGVIKVIDKGYWGDNKEKIILKTKISRSCGG
ncbi:hypothetical protein PG623_10465 [Riemerella anatipestifer]|nr:hypothetical protein [Riemerella anatipestifer]